jgi:rhodanese-related sulfurtransferase
MIEAAVAADVVHRAECARLGITGAVMDAGDSRVDDRADTHDARFDGYVDRGTGQTIAMHAGRGVADRQYFRMGSWIIQRKRPVVSGRQDLIIKRDHGADWNFIGIGSAPRLSQRRAHQLDIGVSTEHVSNCAKSSWIDSILLLLTDYRPACPLGATCELAAIIRCRVKLVKMAAIAEIEAGELKERLERGDRIVVLDVREPGELEMARFPGARHIPMGDIPSRLSELERDAETVVLCHHGIRSAQVAIYLTRMGFEHVLNLIGGIDSWALLDPATPRY